MHAGGDAEKDTCCSEENEGLGTIDLLNKEQMLKNKSSPIGLFCAPCSGVQARQGFLACVWRGDCEGRYKTLEYSNLPKS